MNSATPNTVVQPSLSELEIYGGGVLNQIEIDDLLNNRVAIIQLCNDRNLKLKEVETQKQTISNLNSTIEYLKTTPFLAIISTVVNLIGTTITAIGVNQFSKDKEWLLIVLGGVLVVVGSLATIFYPYAKKWFNKTSPSKNTNH